ncbi:MAG TPA: FAD-binding oxidoreductase [Anaerolineae bacterium]|nr:FAD-binding oxidoreductase [Anaerolineae bacterium]
MKRWNGWGDDSFNYPVGEGPRCFIEDLIGAGSPPIDATLSEVLTSIPQSRLPAHPLVSLEPLDRLKHARGHSLPDWIALRSGLVDAFPDGVAYPADLGHVRDLLRYASSAGACVIPYGGGTSVVGHINVQGGGPPCLSIDLGRLNHLKHFDMLSHLATFGAGVSGPDLEAQLRARGCTLGHFPQSFEYSTLGGWIVTRSSGQQSLGYGRIERLFAGGCLESPAGTLVLPPFPASAAGPDLREAVLGSEGRLGILTEATVRVAPLPQREEFHGFFFGSFEDGLQAVREIMQARLPLCLVRLSTAGETETNLALAGHERVIRVLKGMLSLRGLTGERCMLLVGCAGRRGMVSAAVSQVKAIAQPHGGVHLGQTFGKQWHKSRFRTPYLRNTLWEMGYAIDTLETAVSWTAIPGLVAELEHVLRIGLHDVGERVHVFTHLSHVYPYGSSIYTTYLYRCSSTKDRELDASETLRRWKVLKKAACRVILSHGGTISHQHGVGTDHLAYLAPEKGPLGVAALRSLCSCFDPQGIMNPGKLLA